jgi:hypothetical protein
MTQRIGMIDFDTSHAFAFASRLNHKGVEREHWVDGATVVVGCPGASKFHPPIVPEYTEQIRSLGVPLVDEPEQMLDFDLDGVLIESNCGAQHLERVEFFARRGIPMFVDKPFACSAAEARRMLELADSAGVALMSASSLRFAPELVAFRARLREDRPIVGAIALGPGVQHPKNPGMFHYGVHSVEMLYALLGPGCESVAAVSGGGADVATGVWADGRIGSVRADRPGKGFAFVAFTDSVQFVEVSTEFIYRELLKQVVGMFETGRSPVPIGETLEIVEFLEAANDSAANHGLPRTL